MLTAPPGGGGQRGSALRDSFTAHLLSGPYRSRPGWHLKPSAGHPNSPKLRSVAAWVGSSCPPRAGRQIKCQCRAGHRAATSPTLFTNRGQKPERDRERSARNQGRAAAERPPPGRVEIAWFGRRCPPAPATALKFNSASGTSLYGRARGKSAGEIDAPTATPRQPAGCPAPCNYLTALTEPRNLRESPASSLLSGGRKGNKEAF